MVERLVTRPQGRGRLYHSGDESPDTSGCVTSPQRNPNNLGTTQDVLCENQSINQKFLRKSIKIKMCTYGSHFCSRWLFNLQTIPFRGVGGSFLPCERFLQRDGPRDEK